MDGDKTLKVDKWDILSAVGAVVLIIIIAIFINQSNQHEDSVDGIDIFPSTTAQISYLPSVNPTTPVTIKAAEPGIAVFISPSQIYYDRNYFSYPLFIFPEYSPYFEAGSDAPWSTGAVEFAYMKESTGGVTQIFNVPYRIWKINCTVHAETNPAYAKIKWMLVNSRSGAVIKGAEFYGSGTIYKTVLTYQTDMYFVIEPKMIDYYTIKLETTENYL